MGRTGYAPAEQARADRLEHIQSPKAQTPGRAAGHSPGQGSRASPNSPGAFTGTDPHSPALQTAAQSPVAGGRAVGSGPGPVAEGIEEHHVELSRFSVAASVESCDVYGAPAPMLISRYERSPPPETIEGKPGGCSNTSLHVQICLRFGLYCAFCKWEDMIDDWMMFCCVVSMQWRGSINLVM